MQQKASLTGLNLVVRASEGPTVGGRGGDSHMVDSATLELVDGAVVGCGVTGDGVFVFPNGPGGVPICVRGLIPVHSHPVLVAVQVSHNTAWQAWSYSRGGKNNQLLFHY